MVVDQLGLRGITVQPVAGETLARLKEAGIPGSAGRVLDLTLAGTRYEVMKKARSEEHTSELQSQSNLVCRLLLEKKKKKKINKDFIGLRVNRAKKTGMVHITSSVTNRER